MPTERIQRRIDRLLDEAEAAADRQDWGAVSALADEVLGLDPDNEDAPALLTAAQRRVASDAPVAELVPQDAPLPDQPARLATLEAPESFAGGRYKVLRFLGEGGKKRVFLAHDALLDRDIAFSLIKTDGLDDVGRERIMREAQAMGRLSHQNIVAIYDIGEHTASDGSKQPYLVQELMGGGDVEDLLKDAEGALPLQQSLDIALATARGLEFAHTQGVIHRDIKPGNVWLTTNGEAKIGDLGLAVTLDQSRLTSHGMMVGTYGYMPPEQALGQEVTAQADLYSLGAMLYELVTGRPPFQGDTPTAVISQHLNTQPVSPSWHTEHCPPDLEALILQLLAKVPADRPASATEVIAALTAVDPEARSTSHSDSGANPLDRLARGVFVGREQELEQLRSSLDGALAGRGSLVMLVGEPGIGKTRTTQELETYARMRGANVYWGRTHESSGMPAYWPWIQVGRAWGAARDFASTATQGAIANPELVRLFPELRRAVPGLAEPQPHTDDTAAQFQLFDAYAQFMRNQSTIQPWVVVLDDLHWADKPTLQLLQFVARELSNMNVLVIGTYRDTDLVRTHPLSEALAELNRDAGFTRVNLRGLDLDEVGAYLEQRASVIPSPALVTRVFEETEGNPFFLSEVVNVMAEEGSLSTESVSDISLPDGVREALGRRLDRLSEEANELLGVAAIIGRDFAYETLTLLEAHDDRTLLRLIEEALRARVIEEGDQAGRYRFTHALMQETLLDELSTTRRVMLHGQVGEALEQRWGSRADEYATRLARHFSEAASLTPRHAGKAVHYLVQAAQFASTRSAWAEALRLYEHALELTPLVDGLAQDEEPRLHEAAMEAALGDSNFRAATRHGLTAVHAYRELSDSDGQARASDRLAGGPFLATERKLSLIGDALAFEGGPSDLAVKAQLLAQRALEVGRNGQADADAAAELLKTTTSIQATLRLMFRELWRSTSAHEPGAYALARDGLHVSSEAGQGSAFFTFLTPTAFEAEGLEAALRANERYRSWAEGRKNWLWVGIAAKDAADVLITSGQLDRAADVLASVGRRSFASDMGKMKLALVQGDAGGVRGHLPEIEPGGSTIWSKRVHAVRARGLAAVGDIGAANEEAAAFLALGPEIHGDHRVNPLDTDLILATLDLGLGDWETLADAVFDEKWHWNSMGSVDRWRGKAYLLRGDLDTAQHWLDIAVASCRERGIELELGRCLQDLASLSEARNDHPAALELLEEAGEIYSRLGAGGYLNEVIAKKEILKA